MRFLSLLALALLVSCQDSTTEPGGNTATSDNSISSKSASEFLTPFEESNGNQTPTYPQVIAWWETLASEYSTISMQEMGRTDSGEPLHLVTYNDGGSTDFDALHADDYLIALVNNGIHPGEPDGIDASMLLLRDLATGALKLDNKISISVIPVYNIGGSLNRNSTTRTNQNGPEAYGFRGNARNYDLNRDFIKADTKNARSFAEIFHNVNPDLFVDNHVSNGADYQYVLTHLFTQHNKLGGELGNYLSTKLTPGVVANLAAQDIPITPYVNVWGGGPQDGWPQFMDSPRYSSGYTALWNTIGLTVETHMLKPYSDRVQGTYDLMNALFTEAAKDRTSIKTWRRAGWSNPDYTLNWKLDRDNPSTFDFLGYEMTTPKSEITGKNRIFYDQKKPMTFPVAFYDSYLPADTISIPSHYIIPQGQWEVIDRMRENKIAFDYLPADTTLTVTSTRIEDYNSRTSPYEGHYLHYNVTTSQEPVAMEFKQGDVRISTNQPGVRYLLETLEPTGPDSFFAWNYFDTILQQKEGYSAYVFEDEAAALLKSDDAFAKAFQEWKKNNPEDAKTDRGQLNWIHRHSPRYEAAHMQYPIYRIER